MTTPNKKQLSAIEHFLRSGGRDLFRGAHTHPAYPSEIKLITNGYAAVAFDNMDVSSIPDAIENWGHKLYSFVLDAENDVDISEWLPIPSEKEISKYISAWKKADAVAASRVLSKSQPLLFVEGLPYPKCFNAIYLRDILRIDASCRFAYSPGVKALYFQGDLIRGMLLEVRREYAKDVADEVWAIAHR